MFLTPRLATPGTTPLPPAVLAAVARPMIHHRSPEFGEILARVHTGLQKVFHTRQPVMLLTSSGSGAGEAVAANLFNVGDTVIYAAHGKFSRRWGEMLRRQGVNAVALTIQEGRAPQTAEVIELLERHPETSAVWLTQSETSTSVWTDVRKIAAAVRACRADTLVLVDAVSGLLAHELDMDGWDLDLVFGASQKGLMSPPGLAPIALSERAWRKSESVDCRSVYFDLHKARQTWLNNKTVFTPAVSAVVGLDAALNLILNDGIEKSIARHAAHSRAVRSAAAALGLTTFGNPPSHAVTAIEFPAHAARFKQTLRSEARVTTASGQDDLADKIFRVGHLGWQDQGDMLAVIGAIEVALLRSGHSIEPGAGLSAAQRAYCA